MTVWIHKKPQKRIFKKISLNCGCSVHSLVLLPVHWCGSVLKIMAVGTEFLWKWFPGKTSVPYYTILICVAGAAIIGIFRKIFGDYPEDLKTVMEKVRAEKDTNTKTA